MLITKFGHSCLLVEEGSARILIDPGNYSVGQNDVKNLNAILITHEHDDHCYLESVKKIVANNPKAKIFTNKGAGKKLASAGIKLELLEDGESTDVAGVKIEAFGKDHAVIYPTLPHFDNTGYLIAGKLFHPGDALFVPPKPVEVLALPVVAPWNKVSEVIDYAKAVKPQKAFAIHDGMLKIMTGYGKWPEVFLKGEGVKWILAEIGKSFEV